MENPNKGETTLRTFNTAKLFAEFILFPIMKQFKDFQAQADFGDKDMNFAQELPTEVREIRRYNGLKGMAETLYNLELAISSTVKLKNSIEENTQLDILLSYLKNLKNIFYDSRDSFFNKEYKNNEVIETINRKKFQEVQDNINTCYINTEILMTKNKLIFADDKDDFMNDAEILDQIKREYVEG